MKVKENNASNTEIKQSQREHHGIYRHKENLHSTYFSAENASDFFITILQGCRHEFSTGGGQISTGGGQIQVNQNHLPPNSDFSDFGHFI